MSAYLLGAPGSGKTSLVPLLRTLIPEWVVLDWDVLMDPAGALAGAPIRATPSTWEAYGDLVRTVADQFAPRPVLLLGVCTPDELADWPLGRWALLDCSDAERERRLRARGEDAGTIAEALADAAHYRALGLPVVDNTVRSPAETARILVELLGR